MTRPALDPRVLEAHAAALLELRAALPGATAPSATRVLRVLERRPHALRTTADHVRRHCRAAGLPLSD